uniref:Uncharacterized protein n=1 Tax=Rhizophora mucronata TaxID=61149 RepID=A0A2P2NL89_RHIMU
MLMVSFPPSVSCFVFTPKLVSSATKSEICS